MTASEILSLREKKALKSIVIYESAQVTLFGESSGAVSVILYHFCYMCISKHVKDFKSFIVSFTKF
jgi:hypothetical protein